MADEVTETTSRGSDTVSQSSEWQDQDSIWRSCSSVWHKADSATAWLKQVTPSSVHPPKQWVLLGYQFGPRVAGRMERGCTHGPGLGIRRFLATHQPPPGLS